MGFMRAAIGVTDASGELIAGEQAIGLDDAALAVDPDGLSEPMLLHLL